MKKTIAQAAIAAAFLTGAFALAGGTLVTGTGDTATAEHHVFVDIPSVEAIWVVPATGQSNANVIFDLQNNNTAYINAVQNGTALTPTTNHLDSVKAFTNYGSDAAVTVSVTPQSGAPTTIGDNLRFNGSTASAFSFSVPHTGVKTVLTGDQITLVVDGTETPATTGYDYLVTYTITSQ